MTIANVIADCGRPTLVLSHNKTLAAQLYGELKSFFPHERGRVLHLVLRLLPAGSVRAHRATRTSRRTRRSTRTSTGCGCAPRRRLMERDDVVIVSTVSRDLRPRRSGVVPRAHGDARSAARRSRATTSCARWSASSTCATMSRSSVARSACAATRSRSFRRTRSRACASSCGATRSSASARSIPLTGDTIAALERAAIYPAKHFITTRPTLERAVGAIRDELGARLAELRNGRQAARSAAARAAHATSTSR